MEVRIERDSMGEIAVEEDRLWGAQTQRSLENFKIGIEKMPEDMIAMIVQVKRAAASVNCELGLLSDRFKEVIVAACDEILGGAHVDQFPLSVWQTGSGTQTNMNVNEVLANRANELLGEKLIHPNDHVNKCQSSNDVFPTAMHLASKVKAENKLLPSIERLKELFEEMSRDYNDVVKIGRTHLQDAVPLTLGQEFSAWAVMLDKGKQRIYDALSLVREIAIGGTAVGTGLNAPKGFDQLMAAELTRLCKCEFISAENKFYALSSKSDLAGLHGAIASLACDLFKIANDVRWYASGPRCGIGEILIPENEPGSSIMPGKVNPTQCEALAMVCCQIMGNNTTVGIAASQGNFQLNVYMPVIIYNLLQSIDILSDGMESFRKNCVKGIVPNEEHIARNLERSLMLVTALNPHIGYDKSASIAKLAYQEKSTLKEAAVKLGILTSEEYEKFVIPAEMV